MANTNALEVAVDFNTKEAEIQMKRMANSLKLLEFNANQALEHISNSSTQTGICFSQLATSVASIGVVFSQVKSVVSSIANSYVSFTDTLSKMSQRTGISAEALGGLKFAAEQSGASFEILTDGLKTFQQKLANAQNGDNKLGLEPSGSTEDALMAFADKIKNMTSQTQQVKAATEAFGDAGYKLLPMLQEGRNGIQALKDEAQRLGLTLDEAAIQEGVKLTDATNRMKQSFASVQNQIISGLAPSMTAFFNQLASIAASITSVVSKCPVFVSNLGKLTMAFLAVAGVLKTLPVILTAITAHPFVAVIAGLAVGLSALNSALSSTDKEFQAVSNSMSQQRERTDELIAADKQRIERLKELQRISEEGALNNEEVEEATTLVGELTSKYGDLGIEIDETTGKISGMTNATKKLHEQMTAQRKGALEKEKIELNANIESVQTQIDNIKNRKYSVLGILFGASAQDQEKLKELFKELEKYQALKRTVNKELNSLDAGVANVEPNSGGKTPSQIRTEANAKKQLASSAVSVADYGKSAMQKELDKLDAETTAYKKNYFSAYGESAPDINDPLTRKWYEQRKGQDQSRWSQSQRAFFASLQFQDVQEQKRADIEKKYADQEAQERQRQEQRRAELMAKGEDNTDKSVATAKNKVKKLQETIDAKYLNDVNAGNDNRTIAMLEEELKAAQVELARTVATVSGKARKEAETQFNKELQEYKQLKRSGASSDELETKWKQVEQAEVEFKKQDNEYTKAIGEIKASREASANNQIELARENFESASRGTFNAWEVGSIGNTTAKEQLVTLKNMLNELIELRKNAEEGGIFA